MNCSNNVLFLFSCHNYNIRLESKKIKNQTKISVSDNGKGFDVNGQMASDFAVKGSGGKNMQKRIEKIGGTFSLTSNNGATKIVSLI